MGGKKFIKKNYLWILIASSIFFLVISLWNAWKDSAIFDETAHIGAGYSYVEKQDMRLNPEHPPMIKDLAGIPLAFLNLNFDTSQDFWAKDINGQWDAGKDLLYFEGNNADQIIFFSRLPIVILSFLFGLFIFKWGKEMMGIYGGLLAFLLYTFDPNILGHNHYVTTDLAIAAFITLAFYYFLRFIKNPTWKNTFLLGIFLGLLQLAKFSSVTAFPVMLIILILYPLVIQKTQKNINSFFFRINKLGQYFGKFIAGGLLSLILVFLVYGANTYNMPREKVVETINASFSSELNTQKDNQNEIYTHKVLTFLSQKEIGKPLAYYGLGIAMVFKRVAGGNSVYYLGQVSNQAFASYFPVVFILKETFYHLFLYLAAILISIWLFLKFVRKSFHLKIKDVGKNIATYFRVHVESITFSLFILLYAYISITGNLNLGIRHLFPILPLAYLLTTKNILTFIKKSLNKTKDFILELSLATIFVLIVVEALISMPFYLSYFNPLGGGPYEGYRFVTDSNADWGQDLKRLNDFLAKNPSIKNIRVDYFGGGNTEYYLGEKCISWWDSKRPIETGWYAISANYIQSSLYDNAKNQGDNYDWLKKIKPYAKAGTSIFIYNISPKDLEKLN